MNIYFYILIYIFDIEKCLFCKPERYKNPKTTNFAKGTAATLSLRKYFSNIPS